MANEFKTIFTTDIFVVYHDEILMMRRSLAKKAFPGYWVIPGGHIESSEDPAFCAVRELREETGIEIKTSDLHLTYIAMHRHLDRMEDYHIFAFKINLTQKPDELKQTEEGELRWLKISEIDQLENMFPPIKYYFKHIFSGSNSILFNRSEWEKSRLVIVLTETIID